MQHAACTWLEALHKLYEALHKLRFGSMVGVIFEQPVPPGSTVLSCLVLFWVYGHTLAACMQAKEVERDAILARVTDQHERQRLISLFNNEREEAHKSIEALAMAE